MKKIIFLAICLITTLLSCIVHAETIRFATEATYPPFEFMTAEGSLQGFDIDLAKALCDEMKVDCTFTTQSFNSLIAGLNLGKYDAVIGAMGITPERLKRVNFTNSYYAPSAVFIAPLLKHLKLDTLQNKIIGVQSGTTFELYLRDRYQDRVKVKTYASTQDAFLDLVAGRVDLVLADAPIAQAWLKEGNNSKEYGIVERPIADNDYFGAGYGIAVRKNDLSLLNRLNKALEVIRANGTYDRLVKQYFGN